MSSDRTSDNVAMGTFDSLISDSNTASLASSSSSVLNISDELVKFNYGHSMSELVMCMAWPQAKSQAKPGHTGQAKPKVLAWSWLWPGLDFQKAKANGPDHGFELNILRKLFLSVLL
jgi:hypothetical protein